MGRQARPHVLAGALGSAHGTPPSHAGRMPSLSFMAISGGAAGRSSGEACVRLGLSAGNWNKLTSLIRLYLLRVVCHARMAAAAEDAVVHECASGTWWAA
eukprot:82025-Pelagomonas_calceolata.AAC.1